MYFLKFAIHLRILGQEHNVDFLKFAIAGDFWWRSVGLFGMVEA